MEHQYHKPVDRVIQSEQHIERWHNSKSFDKLIAFITRCSDAVKGKRISECAQGSAIVGRVLAMLQVRVRSRLSSAPPLTGPADHGKLAGGVPSHPAATALRQQGVPPVVRQGGGQRAAAVRGRCVGGLPPSLGCLPPRPHTDATFAVLPEDKKGAAIELAVYLEGCIGNSTRLDYGTGHETAFVVLLLVLDELKLFAPDDYQCVPLKLFAAYLKLVRAFQRRYMLEARLEFALVPVRTLTAAGGVPLSPLGLMACGRWTTTSFFPSCLALHSSATRTPSSLGRS